MTLVKVEMVLDIPNIEVINKEYSDLCYYIDQSVQEFNEDYDIKIVSIYNHNITKEEMNIITGGLNKKYGR